MMEDLIDDETRRWIKGLGLGSCRYGRLYMPADDNKAWIEGLLHNKPIHAKGKRRSRFP